MNIVQAARILRPGTAWNLCGDVLVQAEDGTPRVPVPRIEELQPIIDSDAHVSLRIAAYPSIGDQLDALWKGGKAAADMMAQIQAVKTKYPKP